jgi:ATP-binding cassette subfamily B protein
VVEVGIIYAFTVYIKQLFNPIAEIADQFTSIQSALISADRVFDLMDIKDSAEDFTGGRHVETLRGDIEFKNVWFAYNDENWVLKDVSFTISAGQSCAFIGATGSGKSTVISLLARFYDINKGQILIDGVDIREYNLRDLRRCISVVMQDVFLFSGDLRYNIRLNEDSISDEDIDTAVKSIRADGFVSSLEGGYGHIVAERGGAFSAGERQLVSFARAVAFKPSIYILDEATANIDTQAEAAIQKAVESISDKHTVITIAHRLSTITGCDTIFVMSCGRIVQRGTHEELYGQEGLYKRLYDRSSAATGEQSMTVSVDVI